MNLSVAALAHTDPNLGCGPGVPTYFLVDDEEVREARRMLLDEMRRSVGPQVVLVAGAGNCGEEFGQDFDLDRGDILSWPGAVAGPDGRDLPSMVRVANLANDGSLSPNSAFGRSSVDIAAPGVGHITLNRAFPGPFEDRPELDPELSSGTSQAAAITSGLAALVLSQSPELRGDGCRTVDRILRNAGTNDTIEDRIPAGRVLDALAATRDDRTAPVRACP